jgi:FtsP/CotA-like multicopper oxidase with cupredoxin domain
MTKFLYIALLFFSGLTFAQKKEVFLESRMDGTVLLAGTFQQVNFWGYGYEGDSLNPTKLTLPAPTLRFELGDTVVIRLNNTSPEAHTIHWHGLDVDQENDGVGHTSHNVIPNDTFNYEFVCTHAGTYMYHCHVQTPLHLAMGMYGLFIVEGEDEDLLYASDTKFTKEFSFLFSEMNTAWNIDPLNPGPFVMYEADYVMVNGKSGVQMSNNGNKVIASLYDTLAFRMANIGYGSNHVVFPSELEVYAVGSDGRRVNDFAVEEITLYPGERYDFIAYPLNEFNGEISVDYLDLRNNNSVGVNSIYVEIVDDLGVSSMNNMEETELIYPNPAVDYVYLDFIPNDKWGVYDTKGQKQQLNFDIENDRIKINTSTLTPGVYIIRSKDRSLKMIKY